MTTRTPDLRILSYGGGTQSAALALMSAAGDLPKLDAVIFADTQGELPETYAYAEYVSEILERAGIPFLRGTAGSLEADLRADAPTSSNPTPPAHVANPDGSNGRISAYRCSFDYKRRIITAEVKRLAGGRGAWKRATIEQWIGFSVDEIGRCKPDLECRCGHQKIRPPRKGTGEPRGHTPACTDCRCEAFDPWRINRWPLIELGWRRENTIAWFGRNGHPTPPRSACWFCPNQRNGRWSELREQHPDLFERACQIDDTIRDGGGFNRRGKVELKGQLYLHESRVPLRDADLRTETEIRADRGELPLFDDVALGVDCEAGVCFT